MNDANCHCGSGMKSRRCRRCGHAQLSAPEGIEIAESARIQEQTAMQQTCQQCKHFRKGEPNPMALGQPVMGECRESVHVIGFMTNRGPAMQTSYAQLPPEFPACGRFAAVLAGCGETI